MLLLQSEHFSNWHYILLGEEKWSYLPQVLFKSVVMFIVVLASLRLIGRRGIMQGVFEVLTIIMLGSAAGDPMLYKNVGLLTAALVFIMIVILYKATNLIVAKFSSLETAVEGRAVRFIKDGRFEVEHFQSEELSKDELFSDLRGEGISQLGQVMAAYLEPGGEVSVFFYPDEQVRYGLPTFPELNELKTEEIKEEGFYSCEYCGNSEKIVPTKKHSCTICQKTTWIKSSNEKRVT